MVGCLMPLFYRRELKGMTCKHTCQLFMYERESKYFRLWRSHVAAVKRRKPLLCRHDRHARVGSALACNYGGEVLFEL